MWNNCNLSTAHCLAEALHVFKWHVGTRKTEQQCWSRKNALWSRGGCAELEQSRNNNYSLVIKRHKETLKKVFFQRRKDLPKDPEFLGHILFIIHSNVFGMSHFGSKGPHCSPSVTYWMKCVSLIWCWRGEKTLFVITRPAGPITVD